MANSIYLFILFQQLQRCIGSSLHEISRGNGTYMGSGCFIVGAYGLELRLKHNENGFDYG